MQLTCGVTFNLITVNFECTVLSVLTRQLVWGTVWVKTHVGGTLD